jgi:Amt family ammonium transporter
MAWVGITMAIIFTLIKKTIGLRVSRAEEIAGMDISEHNISSSYADFMITPVGLTQDEVKNSEKTVPTNVAIPVVNNSKPGAKMTKVVVVTKQNKFEVLKSAFDQIGITGMTVTQVLGCGMQRGGKEYYRGIPLESTLLPKVKVEVVICKVPLQLCVDTIKKAIYTGNIGDGKIFVYDVENVIKVRTGEQGYDALQDNE